MVSCMSLFFAHRLIMDDSEHKKQDCTFAQSCNCRLSDIYNININFQMFGKCFLFEKH